VFRESEVENLDAAAGKIVEHPHNIFRFEVAMDYPVAVRCDQCIGELRSTIEDLICRESGPRQRFAPRRAFNVFPFVGELRSGNSLFMGQCSTEGSSELALDILEVDSVPAFGHLAIT
jgi:hypothetical protein